MKYKQNFGNFGEKIAQNYLVCHGYEIICSNWRYSYYEIDIIANYKEKIVFIEVKSRKMDDLGSAQDNISRKKIRRIKKAAQYYLLINDNYTLEPRFDAITVDIDQYKKIAKIKHFKDIV